MPARRGESFTRLRLSPERKQAVLSAFVAFHAKEFDEELSAYRAERMLEFLLRTLGPSVYNQAIADARAFMFGKLEDLDTEFFEPEEQE